MEADSPQPEKATRVRRQTKAGGSQPPVADPEQTTPNTPDEAPLDPNAKSVSHTIGGALRIDY